MRIQAIFLMLAMLPGGVAHAQGEKVRVEVSVAVPGFTRMELEKYLARGMEQAVRIRFVPGGKATDPDRVVWKFRTLKVVWKGGSHNGFPSRDYAVSYLKAEVTLFLGGEYQMTMDTHPSVLEGDEDHALSLMTGKAALALFPESRTQSP